MVAAHIQLETFVLRKVLKWLHYPLEITLLCVRWYAAYPLLSSANSASRSTNRARVILKNLWSIRLAPEVSVKEHGGHDAIELRL